MFKGFFCKKFDFYVAGPMRGKPNGNKDMFNRITTFLRKEGYTVWNPAEQNDRTLTFHRCITKDINAVIHKCKAIVLLPGWENSLGANTETLCAYVCGKKIFFIEPCKKTNRPVLVPVTYEQLLKNFKLPFKPSHTNFRQLKEMDIPENQILEVQNG